MSKFLFKEPEFEFIDYKLFTDTPIIKKYKTLFKYLDLSKIKRYNDGVGCTGYDNHAMIKALIVKNLERLHSVPHLIYFLKNNPYLAKYIIGFKDSIPHKAKFTRFLKNFPQSAIQELLANVNGNIYKKESKDIACIAIDSKPIMANTKENNPKCFTRNLSDKNLKPKKNKDAALSYLTSSNDINGRKKVLFFWGYRIHIITDADNGLPLAYKLEPNNKTDYSVAPELYKSLKRHYCRMISPNIIQLADKGYDVRSVFQDFHEIFNGKSVIPENPRNTKYNKKLSKNGAPLCKAGLAMKSNGSWKQGNRQRYKFKCPMTNSYCQYRKTAYGCVKYLQITDPIPGKIQPFSRLFKELYHKRQSVERLNAFLQFLNLENPKHFNVNAIENTLALALLGKSLLYAAFKKAKHKSKKAA